MSSPTPCIHVGSSDRSTAPVRQLLIVFGLTATFMVVEAVGGYVSGSLALLADAGHMLTDVGALGLTLLTRTMTIALIPGQILAAALVVVFASADRSRRAASFALALAVGIAIAATWYVRSWRVVAEYLVGYGYGDRSVYYGQAFPLLSWARWTVRLKTLIDRGFYLPLAVLVTVSLAAGAIAALWRARPVDGAALRAGLRR